VIYAVSRVTTPRPVRLDLTSFARATGLHPELASRFVSLGLLDATKDEAGLLWFAPSQVAAAARIQRLRAGLSVNYAAVSVIIDLLDRITELETALRHTHRVTREPGPPAGR
jgi:hypothetical protein